MKHTRCLLALAVAATIFTINTHAEEAQERHITGAWKATWTFTTSSLPFVTPGSSFQALAALHEGGTLTSADDDFFDSTGIGTWDKTGNGKHRLTIAFFAFDDQNPGHSAAYFGYVTAVVKYEARHDQWNGAFRSTLRDRAGNLIGEFTGTVVAVRLTE